MQNKNQNKMMAEKQKKQIEQMLNDRRVDDIHKKSIINALWHGLTCRQAKIAIDFLECLIDFKRSVVGLIEDYAQHVPLDR
jgi:F0F1-type ATP synthase delta subunit